MMIRFSAMADRSIMGHFCAISIPTNESAIQFPNGKMAFSSSEPLYIEIPIIGMAQLMIGWQVKSKASSNNKKGCCVIALHSH